MPINLKPGEVPVLGDDGNFFAVPEAGLKEAIRQGGRVATPQELQEHEYGGNAGAIKAAALGAAETLTAGGSTAAIGEYGALTGGQEKRLSYEDQIRQYEQTNPLAHIAGQVAPLALVPEVAGEGAPIVAGESLGARAVNFALPRFARGAAEEGHLQGSQGMSEDILENNNFTAQSYISHVVSPEVLIAGLANVGVGAALHGVGNLLASDAAKSLGHAGEVALQDGLSSEAVTAAAQRSGRTSAEASDMFAGMQDLAQQAVTMKGQESILEGVAKAHARRMAKGSKEVESALNRVYAEATDRFQGTERILDKTTREAVTHSDELFKGLNRMNELQFGLKPFTVERLIDPTKITQQIDSVLTRNTEIRSALDEALTGVDVRGPEIKRLFDTTARLDSVLKDAAAINHAGVGTKGAEEASRKAAGKLYVALDDTKRIFGRSARFDLEGKDGTMKVAEDIFETKLRPLLEDTGIWGEDLGKMQARTNAEFSQGFAATQHYNRMLGQVLETPGGRKLYSTKFGQMRSALTELEHAMTPEDIVGLRAEVIQKVINNTRSRAHSMIETMDLKPADIAELKTSVDAANKLEVTLKRAQKEASEARTLKELKNRELSAGSGGIIKSLTGAITSPVRTQQLLGGLKGAEDRVREIIGRDAKAFVTGERIPTTTAPKPLDRKVVAEAMKDLQKTASDPLIMREKVRKLMANVGDVSPGTGSAVAVTASKFLTYLAGELPPPLPPRFLETEARYAPTDIDTFGRKLNIGLYPLSVFERMQAGRFHTDEQKLISTVYDELYDEMKISLLQEYKKAKENGTLKNLDPHEQKMLSHLMGAPLRGTEDPDFVARLQDAAASDPNAQAAIGASAQGGGRPRKVTVNVDDLKTEAEKISE